jgi:hypothetical protein
VRGEDLTGNPGTWFHFFVGVTSIRNGGNVSSCSPVIGTVTAGVGLGEREAS